MATVTGLTKERMLQIEEASIVNARKEGDNLILTTFGGDDINVGNVRGPKGDQGPAGFTVARIPTETNLNTYNTAVGNYLQLNDVDATLALNYPVTKGGLLEVTKDPLGATTYQRYTTNEDNPRIFIRSYNSSSWQIWAQLSNVGHTHTTAEIISGVFATARIPNLDAAKVTTGTFDTARIPNLDAAKVTTGTFADGRIPNLAASKVTSGEFATARIPNLDAAKVTTGTFDTARIPNLDAAKVTTGTFADGRIPNLAASKVTSGTFAIDRIPTITPEKMTAATETAIGAAERATDAEARAATDTTRYISPANLAYSIETIGSIADSNGVAIKFPDGTMICYNARNVTPVADSVTSYTWTFRQAFAAAPGVTVTANTTATTVRNTSLDGAPGTASCKPGVYRTNNTSTELFSIAVGKWK